MSRTRIHLRLLAVLAGLTLVLAGCGRNMYEQAKFEPLEANPLFEDGAANRVPPPGTVSRGLGALDQAFLTGMGETGLLTELPIELTPELMARGQERYNIYCSVCHNFNGNGQGMIVQKGFPQPASLHEQRLRDVPVGYFYGVITNGFGRMYSYASRIPPEDRWAIAAYIRALQLSQTVTAADSSPELEQAQLAREASQ